MNAYFTDNMTEKDKSLIRQALSMDCEEWDKIDEMSKQADTEEGRYAIWQISNSKYHKSEYEFI
jgi:hypothetical protein